MVFLTSPNLTQFVTDAQAVAKIHADVDKVLRAAAKDQLTEDLLKKKDATLSLWTQTEPG